MDVYVLEVVESSDSLARKQLLGVYTSRTKAMDGRRGPWRESGEGAWTTMNADHGSAWLHPVTGVARRKLFFVRKTQMIG